MFLLKAATHAHSASHSPVSSVPLGSPLMRTFRALFPLLVLGSSLAAAQVRQIAILDVPGQPGFDSIAFFRGHLVMANRSEGTVEVFDAAKRRLVARVEGLKGPRGIAVDP